MSHDATPITTTLPPPWHRLPALGLVVGGGAVVLALLGAFVAPGAFFPAYLTAFLFWMKLSLGCLLALMLHYLVGGAWGFLIRRPLEAAVMTIPLMAAWSRRPAPAPRWRGARAAARGCRRRSPSGRAGRRGPRTNT